MLGDAAQTHLRSDHRSYPGQIFADLLSRMLCYGLRMPDDIPPDYLVINAIDRGFVQGSVFLLADTRPVNTATVDQLTRSPHAVPLVFKDGELWVPSDVGLIPCSPVPQPAVVLEQVPQYGRIGDYAKFHNLNTVFGSPIRECVFGANGNGCQFCTFSMTRPKPLPPSVFASMFWSVANGTSDVALALGPGTPNLHDHGARYIDRKSVV